MPWDRATFNKLHEIKPVLGKNTIYRSLRREEVVLTRLRIGHTRLTNSCLLKREDQPFCIGCNEPFTVKHFLVDCIDFSHVRRQFFQTNGLRYLFENVPAYNILMAGLDGSVGCATDWRPGRGFEPAEVSNIISWRLIMKHFLRSFSPFR